MARGRWKEILKRFSKYNFFILALVFCFVFLNFNNHYVSAQTKISVSDLTVQKGLDTISEAQKTFNQFITKTIEGKEPKQKSLSSILANVLGAALKKIAFDSATWLGSGGHGQKPMFITEGWGPYLTNIGDEAVGQFIEELGKNGPTKFNLCQPNINVVVSIGLGLVQEQRPNAPACTFTQMTKNWSKALQDKKFLNKFQDMFNPTSNDLGIALTLNQKIVEEKNKQTEAAKNTRETNKGWLNVDNIIAGNDTAVPGYGEMIAQMTLGLPELLLPKDYGDAVVNAENVFLNQFFLTLIKTQLAKLGGANTTSRYVGDYGGLTNAAASPENGGQAGMEKSLAKIIQPNFTPSGDFNILAQLAICPDPAKAGPTDCVIDEKLSEAIQNKITVAQAISQGYLSGVAPFGFTSVASSTGPIEPSYNNGYPYRSMMILRKYRILPVGWEMAAQAIKNGTAAHSDPNLTMPITLNYLTACYDDSNYPGWCRGLVDPDWVLKAPQNYCKKQGYGPIASAANSNDVYTVTRNKYCADEQSCIKEKSDGSCEYYGYCTEDRRIWRFGSSDCDPHYNTCRSFTSATGQSTSYLNDTLDYSDCSASNSGCRGYCSNYSPSAANLAVNVSQSSAAMNVNVPINTDFNDSSAVFEGLTSILPPNGNFSNAIYTSAYLGNGNSNIIFYYNNIDDKVYLVFVHGAGSSASGAANFNLNITNTAGDSAQLVLMNSDNTANATYQGSSPTSLPLTIADNSSFSLTWAWSAGNTAGGVIKMPEGDWTLTITPVSWTALNNWQILYEKAGAIVQVPVTNKTQPLTISKTSGNGNWLCTGNTGSKKYFNSITETCDASVDGCHELIRAKDGLGVNYIINGGFEDETLGQSPIADTTAGPTGYFILDNWPLFTDAIVAIVNSTSGQVHSGNNSVHFTGGTQGGFYFSSPVADRNGAVVPANFKIAKDQLYTLSAWVYVVSGTVGLEAGNNAGNIWPYIASSTKTGAWERLVLPFVNYSADSYDIDKFLIYNYSGGAADYYVDDVKLEKGDVTNYSDYGSHGVIYEKLIPSYFMNACYQQSGGYYSRIPGSTSACDNFARYCSATEAGCKMYTSQTTGMSVPAQAGINNDCPASCVGYNKYLQTETPFESTKIDRIIPKLASKCSAADAGCDEFTNLDKSSQGAETKENYSFLRQCRKPDSQCATFYTWEGSDESGYQLHTYQLQQDGSNNPFVFDTLENGIPCNASTYNLLVNPDCREFYNNTGQISYAYSSYTVICSDDCHPFRKTTNNVVVDPTTEQNLSQSDCQTLSQFQSSGPSQYQDINYDGTTCAFCKGNGVWDSQSQACIYMALPSGSKTCAASAVGCREFNGNQGADTQVVLSDSFEDGTVDGWQSTNGAIDSTQNPSNDSLMLGGHSLYVSSVAGNASLIYKTVGYSVQKGKAYVLSFLTNGPVNLTASLTDNAGNSTSFSALQINTGMSGEWAYYQINMPELTHDASSSERLVITNGTAFNIDNIKLTEIVDRYYLIKWDLADVPSSCLYDTLGDYVGYDVNLGCDAYTDSAKARYYLNGFNSLCPESSVGCEEMIDTHNSTAAASSSTPVSTGAVNVSADNVIYAIYNEKKLCDANNKGCTRLGVETKYGNNAVYATKYLKDDPDKYSSILCSSKEDGCSTWTTSDGSSYYFKDPGYNTCEWRQGQGTNSWGWYETKVKRCDSNGDGKIAGGEAACLTSQDCANTTADCTGDSDCGKGAKCTSGTCYYACLSDATDHLCPTDTGLPKTIGSDDAGNLVYQPQADSNNNWVGLCPSANSTCTEYIDPVSRNGENLIADIWNSSNSTQSIAVSKNTLYRFASGAHANDYKITCTASSLSYLGSDNILHSSASLTLAASPTGENSIIFNSGKTSGNQCLITAPGHDSSIELRPIEIDYQLGDKLDKKTCNGLVNYNNGCVLFNERTQPGGTLVSLTYDANLTLNNPTGINNSVAPVAGSPTSNNNANQLVKVTPDRVCDKWLSCNEPYFDATKNQQVCFNVEDCTKMKSDGTCIDPTTYTGNTLHNFDYNLDQNATGYVAIDDYYIGNMSQPGSQVAIPNGDFEEYSSAGSPLDWAIVGGGTWNSSESYVVHSPSDAKKYNINYPANNYGLLRLGEESELISGNIAVKPDTEYYLTYLVNSNFLKSINADASARLTISGSGLKFNGAPPAVNSIYDDTFQGISGWQRKVIHFSSGNSGYIILTLGANSPTAGGLAAGGAIYFDDLEINPTLDVSPAKTTIPRTCRLYPESSSLSCNYYDLLNGVGRGYYGYCLLSDEVPGDPNNCLMWYPVDQINSQYEQKWSNGYTGKAPVYYCTDMNANFDLVEKRATKVLSKNDLCCDSGWFSTFMSLGSFGTQDIWNGSTWASSVFNFINGGCGAGAEDFKNNPQQSIAMCGDTNYYFRAVKYDCGSCGVLGSDDEYCIAGECVPYNDSSVPATTRITPATTQTGYYGAPANDGWYPYDGDLILDEATQKITDSQGAKHGPIMVCDHSKGCSAEANLIDPANYHLTCNEFFQTVQNDGTNEGWSGRVMTGSKYKVEIPSGSGNLDYSFSSEDSPFGSAIIPADPNNSGQPLDPSQWDGDGAAGYQPIKFRDQSNQTSGSVVAGLPYGCTHKDAVNNTCALIGRCSASQKYLCALGYAGDTGNGAWQPTASQFALACPSGESCVPIAGLGDVDSESPMDSTSILGNISQIFARSYSRVVYQGNQYAAYSTPPQVTPPTVVCPPYTTEQDRPLCYNPPAISNVKVYGPTDPSTPINTGNTFTVTQTGFYTFSFNINVDADQMPLVDIYVDWGTSTHGHEDSTDLTGQFNDYPNTPFSIPKKYYINSDGTNVPITFSIGIRDNWNKTANYP